MIAIIVVCLSAGLACAVEREITPTTPTNQVRAEIISEYVICKQPKRYIGWPGITLAQNGDILIAFSGDRDWHVCPWGKIFLVRKAVSAEHFGEPKIIVSTPLDDRGSGLVTLDDGTILLSFFTSTASSNPKIERYRPYRKHWSKISAKTRAAWKGAWMSKSTDNGKTWSEPIPSPVHARAGAAVLSDGRLLLAQSSVYQSLDKGKSWAQIAQIEKNPETWKSRYAFLSEQHAIEIKEGHILGLSRYRKGSDIRLRKIESFDGGTTWTEPEPTPMQGYPAHLLCLQNGNLLATYGRRIPPMGERACISDDDGKTWDIANEIVLSYAAEQDPGSLGYPASIQLPDGTIWTVYYQVEREDDGDYPCLMATHWNVVQRPKK